MTRQININLFSHKRFILASCYVILIVAIASYIFGIGVITIIAKENLNPQRHSLRHQIKAGKDSLQKISPLRAKEIIACRAKEVILAIKNKDMPKLSTLIHPEKGVRFSPYSYVDLKHDLVFTSTQIKAIFSDTTKYNWGYFDGSGAPMRLTFAEYFKQFIYDQDFANAKQISYQQIIGQGNTINNNFEVYPNAIIVEYHFPGFNPKYEGMDWESLRLVFENKESLWYLIGIIHDQWTT